LSAACRTDANLTSVRMAIYTISHWFTDQVRRKSGLKEPRDTALQEWREEVAEKVSRALEASNVRPKREHIHKLVQLATTCRTCKRGECTTGCDSGYVCMYVCMHACKHYVCTLSLSNRACVSLCTNMHTHTHTRTHTHTLACGPRAFLSAGLICMYNVCTYITCLYL
jgi:hypothetical protein